MALNVLLRAIPFADQFRLLLQPRAIDLALARLTQASSHSADAEIAAKQRVIIDQECYSPIRQGYIILNNENSKTVSRFLNFLKKENVKAVFRNFGYTFPEGDMYEQH